MEKESKKTVLTLIICVFAAVLLAFVGFFTDKLLPAKNSVPETDEGIEKTVAAVRNNVFEVKVGNTAATGFIFKKVPGGAVAVTCWHAVKDDAPNVEIRYDGSSEFVKNAATLLGYDADLDIAVYSLRGEFDCLNLVEEVSFADTADGKEVFLIGNSDGKGLSVAEGVVSVAADIVSCESASFGSNINGKSLPAVRVTAPVNLGASGCPVFDNGGKLVGMGFYQVYGSLDRPVFGMSYAVPASVLGAVIRAAEAKRGAVTRDKATFYSGVVGEGESAYRVYEVTYPELNRKFSFEEGKAFFTGELGGKNYDKAEIITFGGEKTTSPAAVAAVMIDCATGIKNYADLTVKE